jgi:hypothetical protein
MTLKFLAGILTEAEPERVVWSLGRLGRNGKWGMVNGQRCKLNNCPTALRAELTSLMILVKSGLFHQPNRTFEYPPRISIRESLISIVTCSRKFFMLITNQTKVPGCPAKSCCINYPTICDTSPWRDPVVGDF